MGGLHFAWGRLAIDEQQHTGNGNDCTDDARDRVNLPRFLVILLLHEVIDPRAENERTDDESDDFDSLILFPDSTAPSACAFSPLASGRST